MLNSQQVTKIHRVMDAQHIAPIQNFDLNRLRVGRDGCDVNAIRRNLGIDIGGSQLRDMVKYYNDARESMAMDALQPPLTTPSMITPIQFLQEWLPGFVEIITDARKIDELVGIVVAGDWHFSEIVQGVRELIGKAQPYGDFNNVPRASYNANYNRRSIVRFEQGLFSGVLQEAISAMVNINDGAARRDACALQLEIVRNSIGFNGYNDGLGLTFGFLNDPGLPAYVPFDDGASGDPEWATKTFLEITRDIRTMFSALRTQSGDTINPEAIETTLALPTSVIDYMTVTADFNIPVSKWLKDSYPKCRVVSAPELDAGNGGASAAYLYANKIKDDSTDGGQVFIQVVPTKFKVTGVMKQTKGYEEDYTNATAGVICKRPYGVVRYTGC